MLIEAPTSVLLWWRSELEATSFQLTSTARTTMTVPLREGIVIARHPWMASPDFQPFSRVGGSRASEGDRTGHPAHQHSHQGGNQESDATKWVIILLVLGTIIPMATWWVFSR